MKYTLFAVVLFAFSVPPCTASLSSTFPLLKFASWYPAYEGHLKESSIQYCNATLQVYFHERDSLAVAHHLDCILANTTETIKANMASAGIILGLMPGFLANMGPTLSDASTITLERPLLSILLAIGAPALYPARPFGDWDPLEGIKGPSRRFSQITMRSFPPLAVSLLQYIIALTACFNTIAVSLALGMKTVLLWKKANSWLPLGWVLLSIVLHVGAAIRLRLFIKTMLSSQRHQSPVTNHNSAKQSHTVRPRSRWYSVSRYFRALGKVIDAEIRPCRARTNLRLPSTTDTKDVNEPFFSYLLAISLPLLSLMHVFVGITIFSSLVLIGVDDTIGIVIRYSISALAVQLIRGFESTGLHSAYRQRRESEQSKQNSVGRIPKVAHYVPRNS